MGLPKRLPDYQCYAAYTARVTLFFSDSPIGKQIVFFNINQNKLIKLLYLIKIIVDTMKILILWRSRFIKKNLI